MLMVQVVAKKSQLQSQHITVWPWEVPILELSHEVEIVGEVEVDTDVPDPAAEFDRLIHRYGNDKDKGSEPFAVQVFGQHRMGVAELARLIDATRQRWEASQRAPEGKTSKGKAAPENAAA